MMYSSFISFALIKLCTTVISTLYAGNSKVVKFLLLTIFFNNARRFEGLFTDAKDDHRYTDKVIATQGTMT